VVGGIGHAALDVVDFIPAQVTPMEPKIIYAEIPGLDPAVEAQMRRLGVLPPEPGTMWATDEREYNPFKRVELFQEQPGLRQVLAGAIFDPFNFFMPLIVDPSVGWRGLRIVGSQFERKIQRAVAKTPVLSRAERGQAQTLDTLRGWMDELQRGAPEKLLVEARVYGQRMPPQGLIPGGAADIRPGPLFGIDTDIANTERLLRNAKRVKEPNTVKITQYEDDLVAMAATRRNMIENELEPDEFARYLDLEDEIDQARRFEEENRMAHTLPGGQAPQFGDPDRALFDDQLKARRAMRDEAQRKKNELQDLLEKISRKGAEEPTPTGGEIRFGDPGAAVPAPKLPSDLADVKPKYRLGVRQFELTFEDDLDKAFYMTGEIGGEPTDTSLRVLQFIIDNTDLTDGRGVMASPRRKDVLARVHEQARSSGLGVRKLTVRRLTADIPTPAAPTAARVVDVQDAIDKAFFSSGKFRERGRPEIANQEQIDAILASDHSHITVWHGTTLRGAEEILRTGEIRGYGGFGPGVTLSPDRAVRFAGRQFEGSRERRSVVVLEFDLPRERFRDFVEEIGGLGADELILDPAGAQVRRNEPPTAPSGPESVLEIDPDSVRFLDDPEGEVYRPGLLTVPPAARTPEMQAGTSAQAGLGIGEPTPQGRMFAEGGTAGGETPVQRIEADAAAAAAREAEIEAAAPLPGQRPLDEGVSRQEARIEKTTIGYFVATPDAAILPSKSFEKLADAEAYKREFDARRVSPYVDPREGVDIPALRMGEAIEEGRAAKRAGGRKNNPYKKDVDPNTTRLRNAWSSGWDEETRLARLGKARAAEAAAAPEAPTVPTRAVPDVAEAARSIERAETGKPFTATLFRGSGRATVEEAYDPNLPQEAILGKGRYTTPDREFAENFGPNIEEVTVTLENPLVIKTDDEWRILAAEAGLYSHVPTNEAELRSLRAVIDTSGHDGVVIRVTHDEMTGKRLDQMFGEDTVFELAEEATDAIRPTTEAVQPPGAPGPTTTARQPTTPTGAGAAQRAAADTADAAARGRESRRVLDDVQQRDVSSGGNPPTDRKKFLTARAAQTEDVNTSGVPERIAKQLTPNPPLNAMQMQAVARGIDRINEGAPNGGFILADGTGVGKTRTELAIAETWRERGDRVLIVAPAEVLKISKGRVAGSFLDDSTLMGVELNVWTGGPTETGKIYVATYDAITRHEFPVDKTTTVIFDEAHQMRNRTARAAAGDRLSHESRGVIFATASPLETPTQIEYLTRAGLLEGMTKEEAFTKLGLEQHRVKGTRGAPDRLEWRVNPQVGALEVLRRREELFDRLTERGQMIRREISLEGVDVSYKQVILSDEAHADQLKIAEALSGPRQAGQRVLAQRLQLEPHKVATAVEETELALSEGRKVILFMERIAESGVRPRGPDGFEEAVVSSQGTAKLLREALQAKGIRKITELHGEAVDVTGKRLPGARAMEEFQSGEADVMIATIKSGGTGINLDDRVGDAARTMIIVTPPFSAMSYIQAIGRVWRAPTRSNPKIITLFANTESDINATSILRRKTSDLHATVQGDIGLLTIPDEVTDFDGLVAQSYKRLTAEELEAQRGARRAAQAGEPVKQGGTNLRPDVGGTKRPGTRGRERQLYDRVASNLRHGADPSALVDNVDKWARTTGLSPDNRLKQRLKDSLSAMPKREQPPGPPPVIPGIERTKTTKGQNRTEGSQDLYDHVARILAENGSKQDTLARLPDVLTEHGFQTPNRTVREITAALETPGPTTKEAVDDVLRRADEPAVNESLPPKPPAPDPISPVPPLRAAVGDQPPTPRLGEPPREPPREPPSDGDGVPPRGEEPPSGDGVPPRGEKPPQPPTPEDAIKKIIQYLKEARPARGMSEELKAEERARRAAMMAKFQEEADDWDSLMRAGGARKGELPSADFDPPDLHITPDEWAAVARFVKKRATDLEYRTYEVQNAADYIRKIRFGQLPTLGEIKTLEDIFGEGMSGALLNLFPHDKKFWDEVADWVGLPKAIGSSLDASATLRQGGVFATSQLREIRDAFAAQLHAFVSEEYAQSVDAAIRNHRHFNKARSSKVYFAPLGDSKYAQLTAREEHYLTTKGGKIPGVKQSERGYVTFLNKLRHDVFYHQIDAWERTGVRFGEKDMDALARYINWATGRGPMFQITRGNKAFQAFMNAIFWAPRFVVSRTFLPVLFLPGMSTNLVRRKMARNLAAYVATRSTLIGLLVATGAATVELNPQSANFGKIVVGGRFRYDPWSGFSQSIRLIAQMVTKARKPQTGVGTVDVDPGQTLFRAGRSKLAPIAALAADVWYGEDFIGRPWWDPLVRLEGININAGDFMEAMVLEDSVFGAVFAIPALLGVGFNAYDTPGTSRASRGGTGGGPLQRARDRRSAPTGGGGSVARTGAASGGGALASSRRRRELLNR